MNAETLLWNLLLLLTGAGLIALPFYPAWSEWRRPRDRNPWPLPTHVVEGQNGQRQPDASTVQLASGAQFVQLQAARIELGGTMAPDPAAASHPPDLQRWQPPLGARPWGVRGWHIGHRLDIASHRHVPCSVVVRGALHIQGPSWIEGDIKARESLRLGPQCHVNGNLFSEGDIRIGSGCHLAGLVMAEGRLQLSPGVVIGSPQQPVSVCADVIDVQGPVLIHGSVHARIHGSVQAPTDPSPSGQSPWPEPHVSPHDKDMA